MITDHPHSCRQIIRAGEYCPGVAVCPQILSGIEAGGSHLPERARARTAAPRTLVELDRIGPVRHPDTMPRTYERRILGFERGNLRAAYECSRGQHVPPALRDLLGHSRV